MNPRGLILLPLAAAGVVCGALAIGSGVEAVAETRAAPVIAERAAPPLDPTPVEIVRSVDGTFLGMDDAIVLDHLRSATIREVRLNRGGSSLSFRLSFSDGTSASYKPLQIHPQTVPRKEVAAYRLERLLGLRNLAPATMRTLHRDDLVGKLAPSSKAALPRIAAEAIFDPEGFTRGEVQFWIPAVTDSQLDTDAAVIEWTRLLTVGQPIPPARVELLAQLSSLLLFDLLQDNPDRFSGGNLLVSPDRRMLFFMDNTFGFQVDPEGALKCRTYLMRSQKFSRRFVAALRRLDAEALRQALDEEPGILTPAEQQAVMARSRAALRYVDGLIARHGAANVLVFP